MSHTAAGGIYSVAVAEHCHKVGSSVGFVAVSEVGIVEIDEQSRSCGIVLEICGRIYGKIIVHSVAFGRFVVAHGIKIHEAAFVGVTCVNRYRKFHFEHAVSNRVRAFEKTACAVAENKRVFTIACIVVAGDLLKLVENISGNRAVAIRHVRTVLCYNMSFYLSHASCGKVNFCAGSFLSVYAVYYNFTNRSCKTKSRVSHKYVFHFVYC